MRVFQLQRWSAVALVMFLTIHMVVVHYPPFHIDFNRIIVRMGQPLWKAIDIGFLFAVLVHALTGAYMVLTDFQGLFKARRALSWITIAVGAAAFIYGTLTVLAFQPPVTALLP